MSTQKHNTLNSQHAPVVAGRPVEGKAAKLAAKKADLDKLAKADIEQEIVLAEAQTDAPVDVAMADGMDASASSTIGAVEGGAGVEGGTTISPLAIGAGVVAGVVGIAALAGGGSSSGSANNTLQQKPPVDSNKPSDPAQPGGNKDSDIQPPAGGQPGGDKQPSAPAQAKGPADAPKVATSGETKLDAKTFFAGAESADKAPEFIKITNIIANENNTTERVRLVRFGDDDGVEDAQGISVKDPAAETKVETPAASSKMSAYEVIKLDKPMTRAEAAQHAARLGGQLLVVDDAKEASWLSTQFRNLLEDGNAWIGENRLLQGEQNAAVRSGDANSISYSDLAAEKLSSYVLEIPNYTHPLMLDGKPVVEGQIIARGDFGKLSWNADNTTAGLIEYIAVDGDGESAKPVEGAKTQTIKIAEDPSITTGSSNADNQNPQPGGDVPDADAQPVDPFAAVALAETRIEDGNKMASFNVEELRKGIPEGATHIEILQVHSHELTHGHRVINWHEGEQGKQPTAYELFRLPGDDKQTLEDFQTTLEGKPFKLLTIDDKAEGDWLKGSLDGTFNIARENYHYNGEGADPISLRNGVVFEYENYRSPLVLENGPDSVHLQPGALVSVESLANLRWDSTLNSAGMFKFIAVSSIDGKTGDPVAGARSFVMPVKEIAQIDTSPIDQDMLPFYPADNMASVGVAHDTSSGKIDGAVFSGKAPAGLDVQQTPDAVIITEISAAGALKVIYDDPTKNRVLTTGQAIAKADFDKVVWDASSNEGGSFKFQAARIDIQNGKQQIMPLTAPDGEEIPVQTVTVVEHPAAPTYADDKKSLTVQFDTEKAIEADMIKGTGNAATHVKITANSGGLELNDKAVEVGKVLTGEDLSKLKWDAKNGEDGSFTLQAVREDGTPIIGSSPVTITVDEHPKAPDYSDLAKPVKLVHHESGKMTFEADLLAGKTAADKPAFVKVTELPAENAKLMLGDAAVTKDQVINADDFAKLAWESTTHQGGTFKFQAMMDAAGKTPILGSVEQTVNVTWVAAPAEATATNNQSETTLDKALFTGSVPGGNTTPEFIKITAIETKADESMAAHVKADLVKDAGKSAYFLVESAAGMTLEEAQAEAAKLGGTLLKLDNADELDFVKQNLVAKLRTVFSDDANLPEGVQKGVWMQAADTSVNEAQGKAGFYKTAGDNPSFTFVDVPQKAAQGNQTSKAVVLKDVQEEEESSEKVSPTTSQMTGESSDAGGERPATSAGQTSSTQGTDPTGDPSTSEQAQTVTPDDAKQSDTEGQQPPAPQADGQSPSVDTPTAQPQSQEASGSQGGSDQGKATSTEPQPDANTVTGGSEDSSQVDAPETQVPAKLTGFVVEFANYDARAQGLFTGEGNTKAAVSADQVLSKAQYEKLSWDSMFNNGGKVSFIEVSDDQGTAKAGALEKTVTITEQPAAAAEPGTANPVASKDFVGGLFDESLPYLQG